MAGFFDRVVVGLSKGITTVSEGSKVLVEKAKLNTKISELQKNKSKIFNEIGVLVYNLQKNGEIHVEQCSELIGQINSYDDEINVYRRQIEELKAQQTQQMSGGVRCECGFVNQPVAKFCGSCGSPVQQPVQPEEVPQPEVQPIPPQPEDKFVHAVT